MKKYLTLVMITICGQMLRAQTFELEQLALDIEKLAQLKNILSDLYKGYEILSEGYSTIRDISEGNFNLHKAFLDGLLLASSAVKNYPHVADIVSDESSLVSEYKTAFSGFQADKHFTAGEISYFLKVYDQLFSKSLDDLSDLANILSQGSLRMSDAERLDAIDAIFKRAHEKLMFLRQFNTGATLLALSRSADAGDAGTAIKLFGIDK